MHAGAPSLCFPAPRCLISSVRWQQRSGAPPPPCVLPVLVRRISQPALLQGLKTGDGHVILGLPLFVNRFTYASRSVGEAWFSGLLGEAGCQALGLLGDEAPAVAAPAPATAAVTPGSGASKAPACGLWTALALGLAMLAASQWL